LLLGPVNVCAPALAAASEITTSAALVVILMRSFPPLDDWTRARYSARVAAR
jgi:hypothetical protein